MRSSQPRPRAVSESAHRQCRGVSSLRRKVVALLSVSVSGHLVGAARRSGRRVGTHPQSLAAFYVAVPRPRYGPKKGRWRWPCALPKIEMNRTSGQERCAVDDDGCQGHRASRSLSRNRTKVCVRGPDAAAGSIRLAIRVQECIIAKGDLQRGRGLQIYLRVGKRARGTHGDRAVDARIVRCKGARARARV